MKACEKGEIECNNLINTGNVRNEYNGYATGIFCSTWADKEGSLVITNCVNKGEIFGSYAMGIGVISTNVQAYCCGNEGNISGNYASRISRAVSGKLENCYNIGSVKGNYVDGIAYYILGKLINVYNIGTLEGEYKVNDICESYNVENGAIIENCFYLQQDSENSIGVVMDVESMQEQSTYTGFDFCNIWTMKEQNKMQLPGFINVDNSLSAMLNQSTAELNIGETFELKAIKGNVVECLSGNSHIAEVTDTGAIKAKRAGNTTVYVIFDDGQILECDVTVIANEPIDNNENAMVKNNDISNATVTLVLVEYRYDGRSKIPSAEVVLNGEILKKNIDYTVTYKNNKNIGTAKVIIEGKGDYVGSINKSFRIVVKKNMICTTGAYKYRILDTSSVAFAGLKNAKTTKVNIPKTVKIGGKIFKVTSVADRALLGRTRVTSVIIGGNVTKIGKEAFKDCKKLSNINIKSTKLKYIGKNIFKGIKSSINIKVPSKKLIAYKKMLKGKGQSKKLKIKK